MKEGIFVSHSSADNDWCRGFAQALKQLGYDVWYDESHLKMGDNWVRRLEQEILRREIFVYVVTPEAVSSEWVQEELALALSYRRIIIPVRLKPAEVSGFASTRQWVNAQGLSGSDAAQQVIANLEHTAQTAVGYNVARTAMPEILRPRRLPIYLLVDCSASMAGAPIEAVNEGIQLLYNELMNDPQARHLVWISIIAFDDTATQYALCSIDQFLIPTLMAGGSRSTGAALRVLAESIEEDLIRTLPGHFGDYRPVVFLLSDGKMTDYVGAQVARLKALPGNLQPTIVALAVGADPGIETLHQITDNVLRMRDVSPDQLRTFLRLLD